MPASDIDLLIAAVREAGDVALRVARDGFKTYRKKDGSSVTDGDLAVDRVLRDQLMGAHPDYGWFSEEGTDHSERFRNSKCWIVDPIDGTSDFIRHGDDWCIGAALLNEGEVIASALYQPKRQTIFTAQHGSGAFCNRERLSMPETDAEPLKIMCSKTDAARLGKIARVPRENLPFLLRLAKLAAGDMAAVVASTPKSDWDLAPATLLVQETGGVVSDFAGKPLRFNSETGKQDGIIACNSQTQSAIFNMLEIP